MAIGNIIGAHRVRNFYVYAAKIQPQFNVIWNVGILNFSKYRFSSAFKNNCSSVCLGLSCFQCADTNMYCTFKIQGYSK